MKQILPLCLGLALSLTAAAQDEMPAIGGGNPAPAATPAVPDPGVGTTIIGERESPIGLYITPWRETRAEEGIDRPARLLQERLSLLDETVFQRQIEYYNALSGALKSKGKVTPQ